MKRYHDMGGDDTDNEVEEIVSEEGGSQGNISHK
jgi:hypothetical protein